MINHRILEKLDTLDQEEKQLALLLLELLDDNPNRELHAITEKVMDELNVILENR
jgi:hypothetical protein